MFEPLDIIYMKEALKEAQKAFNLDETPIGAIVTMGGEIIGRGYNRRNTDKNPLAHAEIIAINEAATKIGDWRLEECTLYITLEPCPMCAGATVQARIPKVVFGARSPKAGFAGSVINILQLDTLNHQVEIVEGVLEEECSHILKQYFQNMRETRKKNK
ncbi:MAG TPA: nucleoside deaminase [Epulopiscium sp.]|nr:nucleoside deaminase [Candidatus Epulonipiscium sp.]